MSTRGVGQEECSPGYTLGFEYPFTFLQILAESFMVVWLL